MTDLFAPTLPAEHLNTLASAWSRLSAIAWPRVFAAVTTM